MSFGNSAAKLEEVREEMDMTNPTDNSSQSQGDSWEDSEELADFGYAYQLGLAH